MLFYEPLFLLLFFPVVLAAFLVTRRQAAPRAAVLLVASLCFYLWAEPLFVPVVLLTCGVDYALGPIAARGGRAGKTAVAAGVATNLAMLATYKYAAFAAANLNHVLAPLGAPSLPVLRIALPIGVSFIVFEKITYLVDLQRGLSRPAPRFATYLLYVFLFPKLLAGPIIKYHELEAQLLAFGRLHRGDVAAGFRRFMLGVVKKVMLADTLATGADRSFAADPALLGGADAWWGVLCFTFQIYLDFSAYSDMAIGLARMLGFQLRENFDRPYIALSVTEFWRRWHISLSTWIREYLYIPLGGNRVSPARRYGNLWLCFLLSGLWHGAAWTYVAWGAYNGVFLVLDRLFLLRWLGALPAAAANLVTFLVTMVGWAVFRASSLAQAGHMLALMLHPARPGRLAGLWFPPDLLVAAALAAAISFLPRVPGFDRASQALVLAPGGRAVTDLGLSLLFLVALGFTLAVPFRPFLYFRF